MFGPHSNRAHCIQSMFNTFKPSRSSEPRFAACSANRGSQHALRTAVRSMLCEPRFAREPRFACEL
eukprot:2983283-Lingulodinium_polyedra.AAC.1